MLCSVLATRLNLMTRVNIDWFAAVWDDKSLYFILRTKDVSVHALQGIKTVKLVSLRGMIQMKLTVYTFTRNKGSRPIHRILITWSLAGFRSCHALDLHSDDRNQSYYYRNRPFILNPSFHVVLKNMIQSTLIMFRVEIGFLHDFSKSQW